MANSNDMTFEARLTAYNILKGRNYNKSEMADFEVIISERSRKKDLKTLSFLDQEIIAAP